MPPDPPGSPDPAEATARAVHANVAAISDMESQALRNRTRAERVSDALLQATGNLGFLGAHALAFAAWVGVNLGAVPGLTPFDPFPFGILTLIVSAEGVFFALFILISQNRMTRQADHRAHLNLQISMLAERETTRMLAILTPLARHFHLPEDAEAEELARTTDVPTLAREIERSLPSRKT
jgi:uncharacterized membrane protein